MFRTLSHKSHIKFNLSAIPFLPKIGSGISRQAIDQNYHTARGLILRKVDKMPIDTVNIGPKGVFDGTGCQGSSFDFAHYSTKSIKAAETTIMQWSKGTREPREFANHGPTDIDIDMGSW